MYQIDHLNRHVSDAASFIAFYTDVLGYRLPRKGMKANNKPYAILMGCGHELFISEKDGFEIDLIEWTDKRGFYANNHA